MNVSPQVRNITQSLGRALHCRWLRSLVNLNKFIVLLIASMITRTLKTTAFFLTILLLSSVAYAQPKNLAYQFAQLTP